jgi:glycosyltransferase involved in cell wall biosynthesis
LLHNLAAYYPENEYYLYSPRSSRKPETEPFLAKPYTTVVPTGILKALWRSSGVIQNLKADKIQLYHGLSHEIPLGLRKAKIPSVVTIHDLIFKHYPDTYGFFDRSIYDLKFKYACVNADKIVAISQSTRSDIIKFYGIAPEKIQVISPSLNPLFLQKPTNDFVQAVLKKYALPTQGYLLYVGSVIPRKNLKTIIESYKHLPESLKMPLVIVGKGGDYLREMQAYSRSIGVEKYMVWIDNLVDNSHLQALYCGAKIFVYPSVYEGFGLPVVEAMLCDVPVITSNVSSLPEAAGVHSECISPTDAQAMAHSIEKILTDSALAQNMATQGQNYVRTHFDAQTTTAQMEQLYRQVIAQY